MRPVRVDRVESDGDLLVVRAGDRAWRTRTLVNASGTWTRPFVPFYPGIASFAGEQVHTAHYPGAEHFRGRRVLVVGGGASAVQFLGELAPVTETLWVTRRPPVWREDFDAAAGLAAVTAVEERVRRGLPPASVVSVTGLALRPQEQEAARLGRVRAAPDVRPDRARRRPLGRRHVRARRRDPLGHRLPAGGRPPRPARAAHARGRDRARARPRQRAGRDDRRSSTRACSWWATGRPPAPSAPRAPAARRRWPCPGTWPRPPPERWVRKLGQAFYRPPGHNRGMERTGSTRRPWSWRASLVASGCTRRRARRGGRSRPTRAVTEHRPPPSRPARSGDRRPRRRRALRGQRRRGSSRVRARRSARSRRTLREADVAMLNLETPVTTRGRQDPKELELARDRYHFRAPARAVDVLGRLGCRRRQRRQQPRRRLRPVGLATPSPPAGSAGSRWSAPAADAEAAFAPHVVEAGDLEVALLAADAVQREGTSGVWAAGEDGLGTASARGAPPTALDAVTAAVGAGPARRGLPPLGQGVRGVPDAVAAAAGPRPGRSPGPTSWRAATPTSSAAGAGRGQLRPLRAGQLRLVPRPPVRSGVLSVTLDADGVVQKSWTPARISADDGRPVPVTGAARTRAVADWRDQRALHRPGGRARGRAGGRPGVRLAPSARSTPPSPSGCAAATAPAARSRCATCATSG